MAYVLAILVAVSFLPQGLFYRHEFLPALIVLAIWLLGWALRCRSRVKPLLLLGPGLLVIGYGLSLLSALRPADALMSFAQILVLSGLLVASATLARGRHAVLSGIALGALLAGGLGLLVRAGFWHYAAAYTSPFLSGPLEYHNSFGALMAAGLLVLSLLAATLPMRHAASVLAAPAALLFTALLFSLSRGVYVLYPIFAIILIGTLRGEHRRRALALTLGSAVSAILLLRPLTHAADAGTLTYFVWLLLGMVLSAALVEAFSRIRLPAGRVRLGAPLWTGAGLLVLVLGYLLRHKITSALHAVLGGSVGGRVQAITVHSVSLAIRLWMDRISLEIIGAHPFIGYGGGAWVDLYHGYQWIWFIANETHNFFTQVFIEGGVLAEAGLLLLLYLLGRRILSAMRGQEVDPLAAGAAAIAVFMLAHAAMDFDLSYLSLAATFFALAGLGLRRAAQEPTEPKLREIPVRFALLPTALLGILLSAPLAYAENLYFQGTQALQASRFTQSAKLFAAAARIDPLDGRIYLDEALLAQNQNPKAAILDAERAARLLGTDGSADVQLLRIAQQDGAFDFGAQLAKEALQAEPLRADTYWYGVPILAEAAVTNLAKGRAALGRSDLNALLRLTQKGESLPAAALYVDLRYVPLPGYLKEVLAAGWGEALAMSGKLQAAEPLLWQAHQDPALRPVTDIWLYAVAQKLGSQKYEQLVATQPWVLWRNRNPLFGEILQVFWKVDRK